MYDGDPDKEKYYTLATDMFYEYYAAYFKAADGGKPMVERVEVPYEEVKLPVMHVTPEGDKKGVLLIHGGNDSYFEEFFFPILYLRQKGYEVYLFEGPGQGGVVRIRKKHFTHEWEKPVKAVLDYFHLEDVTIVGVSLGGYLAPRAAAFERRIAKVVAFNNPLMQFCLYIVMVFIIERGGHDELIAQKGQYYQLYTGAFELE